MIIEKVAFDERGVLANDHQDIISFLLYIEFLL